jgi:hypothetical protein
VALSQLLMLLVALSLQGAAAVCSQQPASSQQHSHAEALLQRWPAESSRLQQLIAGTWQCRATLWVVRTLL